MSFDEAIRINNRAVVLMLPLLACNLAASCSADWCAGSHTSRQPKSSGSLTLSIISRYSESSDTVNPARDDPTRSSRSTPNDPGADRRPRALVAVVYDLVLSS